MIKVSQYGNNSGTRKPQNSSTLTEKRNKSIVDSSLIEKKPGAKDCMVLMYSKCGNCRGLTQCFHINDNYLSG